ncbi:MAG: FtsQ-type POTRA domain-containing protein [Candidatus Peribacteraceae bacterium]|nr:FtsQ-type POTRA domain-containing protein [Candidatus Peribacteraceae bacterium]MDD5742549.1 FtsQ-type POTRA domain-containing protein [Candidatus Peribacteraceae bacterium]
MSLRPASRLPQRFNRPVSRRTQRLVARRHAVPLRNRLAVRWRRWVHATRRGAVNWRTSIIRWSAITLAALILLAVGIVAFSPIGQVEEIRVSRSDPRLDIEEVQQELAPVFGRSLVTVSGREIRSLLEQRIMDIRSVTVTKHYPSQLFVRVDLTPLVARARVLAPGEENLPPQGSGATLTFVTGRGTFAMVPPGYSGGASLPLIDLVDWGIRPEPGSPILSQDLLERMQQAVDTLQTQFGQPVKRRVAFIRAQEFHLSVEKVSLWFDVRSPLEEQLLRYRMFLRSVGLSEVKEYVDLRLADRVIYR